MARQRIGEIDEEVDGARLFQERGKDDDDDDVRGQNADDEAVQAVRGHLIKGNDYKKCTPIRPPCLSGGAGKTDNPRSAAPSGNSAFGMRGVRHFIGIRSPPSMGALSESRMAYLPFGLSRLNSFNAVSPRMFRLARPLRKGRSKIVLGRSKSQCGQSEA